MASVTLQPSDTWTCECGHKHQLGAYVAAHWSDSLVHTCEHCGRKHSLLRGVLKLKAEPKKSKDNQ